MEFKGKLTIKTRDGRELEYKGKANINDVSDARRVESGGNTEFQSMNADDIQIKGAVEFGNIRGRDVELKGKVRGNSIESDSLEIVFSGRSHVDKIVCGNAKITMADLTGMKNAGEIVQDVLDGIFSSKLNLHLDKFSETNDDASMKIERLECDRAILRGKCEIGILKCKSCDASGNVKIDKREEV